MARKAQEFDMKSLIPGDTRVVTVAGLGYGDEGKGKVAATLEGWFDIVVAANGGGNAGHNVIINEGKPDERKLHFHELPGAAVAGVTTYISGGRVVNVGSLAKEIQNLGSETGKKVSIILSASAQVIVPALQETLDKQIEEILSGCGESVGTTKKGIGPAYGLKSLRLGINVGQLLYDDKIVSKNIDAIAKMFGIDYRDVMGDFLLAKSQLQGLIEKGIISIDETNTYVSDTLAGSTQKMVVECSQSAMLSLSSSAYPKCTSSECGFNGVSQVLGMQGSGFRIGVIKSIFSKVGSGIFPTKLDDSGIAAELVSKYREQAGEYGATTGRPRDVGFMDAVLLKHVFGTGNKPDILWINMVDLLKFFKENGLKNKVAVAYKVRHKKTGQEQVFTNIVPPSHFEIVEVVYEELPDVGGPRDYKKYVDAVRKYTDFSGPIVIGTGPGSKDNILFAS